MQSETITDRVKQMLQEKPSLLHGRDEYEFSVLHAAGMTDSEELVRYLLDRGADVHSRNDEGITPLHIVLYPQIATLLIRHGADVNAAADNGNTPLHTQTADGEERLDVIEVLLAHGADKQLRNNAGRTPLAIAESREEEELVARLS